MDLREIKDKGLDEIDRPVYSISIDGNSDTGKGIHMSRPLLPAPHHMRWLVAVYCI